VAHGLIKSKARYGDIFTEGDNQHAIIAGIMFFQLIITAACIRLLEWFHLLVPIHKWPICPIPALHEKFNPRNINQMPAVKFYVRIDIGQIRVATYWWPSIFGWALVSNSLPHRFQGSR
jgi:hypothetical protein